MLSVIVPVHNESGMLTPRIRTLEKALDRLGRECEIIICEDGSSDSTPDIARGLATSDKRIRLIETEKREGRGISLSNAIRAAKGGIVVYMDADMATDLAHLAEIIAAVEEGADIATGSRLLPGSKVSGRSALREIASRSYNLLLRLLFNTGIKDHQCGFKAFRKAAVLPLLGEVRDGHWFWDSELLIRAQRRGLRVVEIPVGWNDRKESRVRLHSDISYMGLSALRLRIDLWRGL
jgi:glycosyltransferase involved in cell wall biosynthesis